MQKACRTKPIEMNLTLPTSSSGRKIIEDRRAFTYHLLFLTCTRINLIRVYENNTFNDSIKLFYLYYSMLVLNFSLQFNRYKGTRP